MINRRCFKLITAAWLTLASTGSIASEAESAGEHKKHALGVFAGVTVEEGENHDTFGIEYAYRFNRSWSFGGVVERAEREKESTLVIAFAHWWPYKGLFLGAGLGRKDPGEERENTVRATIGYEFELGEGWIIEPQVSLDVIENNENEEVYGIVLGKQF